MISTMLSLIADWVPDRCFAWTSPSMSSGLICLPCWIGLNLSFSVNCCDAWLLHCHNWIQYCPFHYCELNKLKSNGGGHLSLSLQCKLRCRLQCWGSQWAHVVVITGVCDRLTCYIKFWLFISYCSLYFLDVNGFRYLFVLSNKSYCLYLWLFSLLDSSNKKTTYFLNRVVALVLNTVWPHIGQLLIHYISEANIVSFTPFLFDTLPVLWKPRISKFGDFQFECLW